MAQVYERTKGKWYLRFYKDGKRHNLRIKGVSTRKEATAALKDYKNAKLKVQLEEAGVIVPEKAKPKNDTKFDDLAAAYVEHCATKAPRTEANEIKRLNKYWVPLFKGKTLDKVTPAIIEKWKQKRKLEGISDTTIRSDLMVLKTMFNRAKEWGMFSGDNPIRKLPKQAKRELLIPKPSELQKYLEVCGKQYYPIALTLMLTGVRIGELLALQWKDVDFEAGTIHICSTYSLKNELGRFIPIHAKLLPVLKALPSDKSKYVFPGEDGVSKRATIQHAHYKARKKAGLPHLRIHDFRHIYASLALKNTPDIAGVSKLLGHKSTRITTEVYHHMNMDQARKIVASVDIDLPNEK